MLRQSVGGAPVGGTEEPPLEGNTRLAEDKRSVRGIFEVPSVVEGVLEAGDLDGEVQADMRPPVCLEEAVGWSRAGIELDPTSSGGWRVAWRDLYIAGGEQWAGGLACELRRGHYGECASVPGCHAYS